MVSMNDVPVNDLIEKAAESLKKMNEMKQPEWAAFVKTGTSKERPPARQDWWHVRAAAILRATAKLGPIGVSKLRTKYGGRKNRGHKPDKFFKGSGNIIRKILQQLEKAQLIRKNDKDGKKGRVIAPKGMALLSRAAYDVSKNPSKREKEMKTQPEMPRHEKPKEKPVQIPQQQTQKPKPEHKPQQAKPENERA